MCVFSLLFDLISWTGSIAKALQKDYNEKKSLIEWWFLWWVLTGLGWRSLTLAATEHSGEKLLTQRRDSHALGELSWHTWSSVHSQSPTYLKCILNVVLPWLYPDLVMRKVREKKNKIGLWTRNSFFPHQGRGRENLIYPAACSSCWAGKEPHQGKLLISTI